MIVVHDDEEEEEQRRGHRWMEEMTHQLLLKSHTLRL